MSLGHETVCRSGRGRRRQANGHEQKLWLQHYYDSDRHAVCVSGLIRNYENSYQKLILTLILSDAGYIEYPLTVIGTWFGIPLTSMSLIPMLIGSYYSYTNNIEAQGYTLTSLIYFTTVLGYWFYTINAKKSYTFYALPKTYLFLLVVGVQISSFYTSLSVSSITSYYLNSYYITQIQILSLKYICRRMRPAHACYDKLKGRKRMLKEVTFLGTRGFTVFEAFPSGDAAGGMVASTVVWVVTGSKWSWIWALGASYGRIYFFAHHVFDVFVGCLIAGSTTLFLKPGGVGGKVFEGFGFGGWDLKWAVIGTVLFVVCYKRVLKQRKPVPKGWESKTGNWLN